MDSTEKLAKARAMRKNPTDAEATMWALIHSKQLGVKFRRQAIIGGYIVDFYCPSHNLIIEVDGAHHSLDRAQVEYDANRTANLNSYGHKVLRFTNQEVLTYPGQVVKKILEALL